MSSVMWFRRDLRLADNPALHAAVDDGGGTVVPLFVLDPTLWRASGPTRQHYLAASLASLAEQTGGLQVRRGDPAREVLTVARAAGAETVHASADFGPYGRRRDQRVAEALAEHGIRLVTTGSPYVVDPGTVRKPDGDPYRVFTPFARRWREHDWPDPVPAPTDVDWLRPVQDHAMGSLPDTASVSLPEAGEQAARRRWQHFVDTALAGYAEQRDRPDLDLSSRMSVHLKWGEMHPRSLLADLRGRGDDSTRAYVGELAWREFYADVLWHQPQSAREYLRPEFARMAYDEPTGGPADPLTAWCEGRTGYPVVDAGMRQLLAEGWMHNRVRMITASFLVKDLHVEWQHGARHFLRWLVDGDLASNQHGWQWVAGSGTDAAPYFRVFNPVSQGKKFDPRGDYVRRYVPELRGVPGAAVHEPWLLPDGLPEGYPAPLVDHAEERREALRRYEEVKG